MKFSAASLKSIQTLVVIVLVLVVIMFADNYLFGANKRKLFARSTTVQKQGGDNEGA
ncbi:MAG: hypothetical protein PHU97_08390 [Bacteroidales bacterium]|nr:hypothetical protein [Bacteroidales bacterium]MDD3011320.1 hypothetical protein [Bacteroidales bacterium]MDD3962156.1 hypothetical protein [Bacteroidales bacterium]MDY0286816.1 hypothetical protein [Bacteroidales bacterium]